MKTGRQEDKKTSSRRLVVPSCFPVFLFSCLFDR
jgi:hypothetical protein